MSEVNGELPEGWLNAKLLDLIDYEGGTQPPKSTFIYEPREGYVRLVQIRDYGDKPHPTYVPDSKRLKKTTAQDLMLARYGGGSSEDSLGRICWGLNGVYNVALVKLVFNREVILPGFVRTFFLGPWFRDAVSVNSRSCQVGFNRDDLKEIPFPVPPLAEQRRIVAAVEALLIQVNTIWDRLNRVPALLKRFRQAILAAACDGRLTADWREGHPNIEQASALIDRIKQSRSLLPATDNDPVVLDGADAEIPNSWEFTTLGFLAEPALRGRPFVTSGSRGWAQYVSETGPYFIRSENINTDYLSLDDAIHVSPPDNSETERTRVQSNDLLLTITGNNVGRSALVPEGCPLGYVSQHVAIIRTTPLSTVNYLWLWLKSEQHGQKQLRSHFYGYTKPGLNLEQVKSVSVALPPVAEQHEIIRRVNALFGLADQINAKLTRAKKRVDKLTQAILAKAFRGELVPTEAELARREGREFESAEELLGRINRETVTQTLTSNPRRRRSIREATP